MIKSFENDRKEAENMKEKRAEKFEVYARRFRRTDFSVDDELGDWEHAGTTYAKTEKQAINNVRFRTQGKVSKYGRDFGSCVEGYEWKAKRGR